MATINVTNFSPMIEVNVKVFLQLPQNPDTTVSSDGLEKASEAFASSHCTQVQKENAHLAVQDVSSKARENVECILSKDVVEKSADEQVGSPNNKSSQEEKEESVKATIVGGSWTIDPQIVVQLLDVETLRQVLVKALTS